MGIIKVVWVYENHELKQSFVTLLLECENRPQFNTMS